MNGDLRKAILTVLKFNYPKRLRLSELDKELGGRFSQEAIDAELVAMDAEGLVKNDLEPVTRITLKGIRANGAAA